MSDDELRAAYNILAVSNQSLEKIAAEIEAIRQNKCAFCGGVATLLCDYILGRNGILGDDGAIDHAVISSETYKCDAPICKSCTKYVGSVNFSPNMGGHDTIDYCPVHKDLKRNIKAFISAEKAEQIRLKVWKLKLVR